MWVFGYGSLIFRPGFRFAERRVGFIRGWKRRFWQGSTDHRGVPGAPGRVVTLIGAPDDHCWGVAYRLESDDRDRALAELDVREQGGYARQLLRVTEKHTGIVVDGVITYIGTPQNPNYLGPASTGQIARQILRSHGPSGANADYLFRLADALRAMDADDSHVFEVESAVRALPSRVAPES